MTDFADDALALLRSLHRDFEFWIVKKVGVEGYMWCAKRTSDETTVNADSPEQLVEAIRQLESGLAGGADDPGKLSALRPGSFYVL